MATFRIAPTPSGFLHVGNGVNFALTTLAARAKGATLLLRIDDMDAERKRPEYVEDIFETLHWMGIEWHEGPRDAADFEAKWSNRHRMALYEQVLNDLVQTGLVYACGKSRKDLEPFHGTFPKAFREQGLSLEAPDCAWRVCTPDDLSLSDFVVRRRDGLPAYQIASLADDIHWGITHLVRGMDLAPSSEAQQWLASVLGPFSSFELPYTDFLRVAVMHHPLLLDAQGRKLSKSAGAAALKQWRTAGKGPEEIWATAQRLCQDLKDW
jgi:glutamyl-tRNA synthetase